MTTPIVHITDKEQALQRENANMLDTINKQAASIEKLRKVVEMKDLTIEAQASEIEGWKADQKENIAVTFKQQAEIDKLKAACDKFSESEMLLKALPVQEPVAWIEWDANTDEGDPDSITAGCNKPDLACDGWYWKPLYLAAPVQPVQPALTDAITLPRYLVREWEVRLRSNLLESFANELAHELRTGGAG